MGLMFGKKFRRYETHKKSSLGYHPCHYEEQSDDTAPVGRRRGESQTIGDSWLKTEILRSLQSLAPSKAASFGE